MAMAMNEADLWLSAKFLAADGNKENNKNGVNGDFDAAAFGFPSEFPYEFDSFGVSSDSALSSPVESVAGSTESSIESGGDDVDENFFAALARRLGQSSLYETPKLTVPTKPEVRNF